MSITFQQGKPGAPVGMDAGGRTRVSQLTTLLDGKIVNGHTSLIFEEAGTGTFTGGSSKNLMEVDAGEWCVYQTRRHYPYFSGKSQVVEFTFDQGSPETGLTKRMGYFSSNAVSPYDSTYDGMWIESGPSTIAFKVSRAGTLTLNVDIEDWTGYENLGEYKTLSTWDNFTVCMIDFLWLGGAVCRLWVKTSGGFVLAHQFDYSGTAQDVFMLCPCQPLRYEIRSTTGAGSLRYICAQVATEGSIDESGIVRSVDTTYSTINLTTAGTVYPLIGLKKQSAYRGVAVTLQDFSVFVASATDQILWSIQINPTLSAGLTYNNVANSAVAYGVGNGTITVSTPGTQMASGPASQNQLMPTELLKRNFLAYMGGNLANTMDEYVLCATPISGKSNVNIVASMSYKEF